MTSPSFWMQRKLESASQKRAITITVFVMAAIYVGVAASLFAAGRFADYPDARRLRIATRLDPANADYRHRLGRYFDLVLNDPASALTEYQRAIQLNPHDARYWLDLANAYQLLGDADAQAVAIERAVVADPKTPDVAWEAANLYLVRGQTEKALAEFRLVMEGAPYLVRPGPSVVLENQSRRGPLARDRIATATRCLPCTAEPTDVQGRYCGRGQGLAGAGAFAACHCGIRLCSTLYVTSSSTRQWMTLIWYGVRLLLC